MITGSNNLKNRRRSSSRLRSGAILEALETRQLFSLLGIGINTPVLSASGNIGDVHYSASAHTFDMTATPSFVLFPPIGFVSGGNVQLHIKVDNSGNLIGSGSFANDLEIDGSVSDGTNTYNTPLLTGTIVAFGSQITSGVSGAKTDFFDFRFHVTGGSMATLFSGQDIGLILNAENSTALDFTADFSAKPKLSVGPTPPVVGTPKINIVKSADQTSVAPGGTVTYTYTVTNPGTIGDNNVVVTDDNGTPANTSDDFHPAVVFGDGLAGHGDATHNIGDANNNGVLDPGEAWSYTATRILTGTGTTSSSIGSSFDGTPIAAGNVIWFNSVVKPGNVSAGTSLTFFGSSIIIGTGPSAITVPVPNAIINFTGISGSAATTVFDSVQNAWVTTVPASGISGNVFLTAVPFVVTPAAFTLLANGGGSSVKWFIQPGSNKQGVQANWQWAANVYAGTGTNAFTAVTPANYNLIGIKPLDTSTTQYANSDHAGTPENFKSGLVGGARGGGGSNFTGSYSGTGSFTTPPASKVTNIANVTATALGQNATASASATVLVGATATASISGNVFADLNKDGKVNGSDFKLNGVLVTLTGTDMFGTSVTLTMNTDINGNFNFTGLIAGNYTLTITPPSGYKNGKNTAGTDGGSVVASGVSNISLGDGDTATGYLFGEQKTI